ncbi:hypothetical protein AGMMS49975_08180 [Clostridia bacterium]|nr:hypothetical protein AGMMS49975_08180 [Clostridia bacterium]
MGILAVYDAVGIQSYIFSSNKLSENVGASKLVADIFGETLRAAIMEVTKEVLPRWQDGKELDTELSAEIIYQGGGNAYVSFKNEDIFNAVTKKFLTNVSQGAAGVGIAVAAIETDFGDTYKSDFDTLNKRLSLVKGGFNIPVFAGNQPITKQSGRTGLPASEFAENEYLSNSQKLKRDRYKRYKKEHDTGYGKEIEDFDDLIFGKGEDSLIAIVHADGNNMGSRIKSFMEKFETYAEAAPKIRALSVKIDECYKQARERTISLFKTEYPADKPLPLIELIGDGDDTTLVIGGHFALDFTARLLREIENTPEDLRPFSGDKPTACAGVVIFHSHYPFSEAYKLVEALCASAKKPSRDSEGSYLDFHLHQSGGVSELSVLRKRLYLVNGKSILRRPWRVSDDSESEFPNFKWFEENTPIIKEIPRNKAKAIRNAIGAGDVAAKLAENQLRGEKLPKFPLACDNETSSYAHIFDILEISDIYENLLNKGDAV